MFTFYFVIFLMDLKELGDSTAILTNTLDTFLNYFFLAPDVQHQTQIASELVPVLPVLVSGLQEFGKFSHLTF